MDPVSSSTVPLMANVTQASTIRQDVPKQTNPGLSNPNQSNNQTEKTATPNSPEVVRGKFASADSGTLANKNVKESKEQEGANVKVTYTYDSNMKTMVFEKTDSRSGQVILQVPEKRISELSNSLKADGVSLLGGIVSTSA